MSPHDPHPGRIDQRQPDPVSEAMHYIDGGHGHEHQPGGHRGHGLMMLACCVPMLLIAVALVVTGVAGSGAIVAALLCTAMMAAMMFMMRGGHGHK
jgi:hypothetical protein